MVRVALLSVVLAPALIAGSAAATTEPKPTEGVSNVTPLWSPDSTRIAFVADAPGPNNHDLWVVRVNGTGFLDLTPDDLNEGSASWSPDGSRLAFTSGPILTAGSPSVE